MFSESAEAQQCKDKGNALFKAGRLEEAVVEYSCGVGLDQAMDAVLLCNQAACELKLRRFEDALRSATASAELRPAWSKAHFRRAEALLGKGEQAASLEAFRKAQQLQQDSNDSNANDKAIAERIAQLEISGGGGSCGGCGSGDNSNNSNRSMGMGISGASYTPVVFQSWKCR